MEGIDGRAMEWTIGKKISSWANEIGMVEELVARVTDNYL